MPGKKTAVDEAIDLAEYAGVEMTYVVVGHPARQFDTCDKDGMVRVITTAKISNPEGTDQNMTLQDMLDNISERKWKPGPAFSAGTEKTVWILYREKVV